MAEFCPTCPLRGACVEPIEYITARHFPYTRLKMGILVERSELSLIAISECVDVNGGHSELIEGVDHETIIERVAACDTPIEKTYPSKYSILRPKTILLCGGLGVGATVKKEIARHYYNDIGQTNGSEDAGTAE